MDNSLKQTLIQARAKLAPLANFGYSRSAKQP
jgi:hypothetical protein